MKTIKKFQILWAIVCTMIAIALCVAVCREYQSVEGDMLFSKVAGCLVYIAGCVGLYVGVMEFANFIDYWWGNGDIYYKGRKR